VGVRNIRAIQQNAARVGALSCFSEQAWTVRVSPAALYCPAWYPGWKYKLSEIYYTSEVTAAVRKLEGYGSFSTTAALQPSASSGQHRKSWGSSCSA
jgi:hypothetical protein